MATPTDAAAPLLRGGLLGLGALTTFGIAVELAVERHWSSPSQLLAWLALGVVALALAILARAPSRARVRLARGLAVAALIGAVWGVWEHVEANHDAGELDFRYADTWVSLPEATRWWLAVSKTVGPSPPLAPGALAQAGLCVLLATLRHPALGEEPASRVADSPAERIG